MKRHGNLFETVFSAENMYQAYLEARKGKRLKPACHQFDIAAGALLVRLRDSIRQGTYSVRPYYRFYVHEPKRREIRAPWFGDIVVQHAIYRVIKPIFDKAFISTSFACRVGKGTHAASDYTQAALQQSDPDSYTLKMDIRKFFYRIDRAILRRLIERKIKDKRLVDVMMLFAETDEPVGIPIGNLLSQTYALIYLDVLDHYIKRKLQVKRYCRYVDDFILFGLTREQCEAYQVKIEQFLAACLGLELSKWSIQKVRRGVNFVGYRTWRTARFIRKYSLHKFRRFVSRGKRDGIISLLGHAKYTCSLRWMLEYLQQQWNSLFGESPAVVAAAWRTA
ncbi:MAG: reverse transcriptase domain-containing protein [Geobacter sp.]